MNLRQLRNWPMDVGVGSTEGQPPPATTGTFLIEGAQKYFSLECASGDPLEILPGSYQVVPYKSPRFQALLKTMAVDCLAMRGIDWVPRLISPAVEKRDPIEIHVANFVEDIARGFPGVAGCIALGMNRASDRMLSGSRNAIEDFYPQLKALGVNFPTVDGVEGLLGSFGEEVWLTVEDC